jgi:hypothetical protein
MNLLLTLVDSDLQVPRWASVGQAGEHMKSDERICHGSQSKHLEFDATLALPALDHSVSEILCRSCKSSDTRHMI